MSRAIVLTQNCIDPCHMKVETRQGGRGGGGGGGKGEPGLGFELVQDGETFEHLTNLFCDKFHVENDDDSTRVTILINVVDLVIKYIKTSYYH